MARISHREAHRARRIGWLRAALLGAYDGNVFTATLMVGVAAALAAPVSLRVPVVAGASLLVLTALGAVAMRLTAGAGLVFGTVRYPEYFRH